MTPINRIVSENRQQIKKFSSEVQSISPTLPPERQAAIFAVINLARGTMGWNLKEAKDLKAEIGIWAISLDDFDIPNEHLPELWKRARDLRITRLQNGLQCPDFTVELLCACWIGENGLKAELQQREINAKNRLPDVAKSKCLRCFATGIEWLYTPTGSLLGCRPHCRHKPLEKGEWLYQQALNNQELDDWLK